MPNEPAGFAIIPRHLLAMQPVEVKVYMALALYVNWDTGECWPSRQTLAHDAGVSLSTVKRAIKALVAYGAIQSHPRRDPAGDSTSNLYVMPFVINQRASRGGVTGGPTSGHGRTHGGVTRGPLTTTRTTREGLTSQKNHPERCAHVPIDDDGYCTACGTTVQEATA
jgi:DNA-binding transcriptional MocR family regulator